MRGAVGLMQQGRFELKYLIDFSAFRLIRERMSAICQVDPHAVEGNSYLIRSIYYDTRGLDFFKDKLDGIGHRLKVRIRFYGNKEIETAFAEIKNRHGSTISKLRHRLGKDSIAGILGEGNHELGSLFDLEGECIEELKRIHLKTPLIPQVGVSYWRQAYIWPAYDNVRLTFDYDLRYLPEYFLSDQQAYERLFLSPGLMVMEVKTDGHLPIWFREVGKGLNLQQTRYSKYCSALGAKMGFSRVD